jgi:hypothetical protein
MYMFRLLISLNDMYWLLIKVSGSGVVLQFDYSSNGTFILSGEAVAFVNKRRSQSSARWLLNFEGVVRHGQNVSFCVYFIVV